WMSLGAVCAHDAPTSFIDLRVGPEGIDASVTASNTDLAHELPAVEPDMLLQPAIVRAFSEALATTIHSRLRITAIGHTHHGILRGIVRIPEKRGLRLDCHYSWSTAPASINLQCRLFPYDQRHRTFLNIYQGDRLDRQEIFEGDAKAIEFHTGSRQSVGAVVR